MDLAWFLPMAPRSYARAIVFAVATPMVATATMLTLPHVGVTTAALAYVLAVAAAALIGGLVSGSVAAVLSFAALHYFFTPPRGFGVPKTEDFVALVTFLAVSVIVGAIVSTAVSLRIRAERRAEEARLLHQMSTHLLAGQRIEEVLRPFAHSASDLFGLERCEITTELSERVVSAGAADACSGSHATWGVFPMTARGREVGSIVAVPANGHQLGGEERQAMRMFADQLALALEDVRLGRQVKEAELDAVTNKARAALFASVTHDLRTPLASILASATSLRDLWPTFDTADRGLLLDAICTESDRLNRLVGNLLDMSRIRAGALRPERVPASIGEIVDGVVARLEPRLSHHDVYLNIDPDLPEVFVDVLQIDQVLTNLLENAAKFARSGTRISVSVAHADGWVRIESSDQGPGIDRADRERVFEPFEGGHGGPPRGVGLGLAICRAIVEAHGGRIWIEEPVEPGTSVVFELPIGSP